MFDAVVLAGSINNGALSSCSQAKNEALIKICDRYMVEYVIEALLKSANINNIYIVGLDEKLKEPSSRLTYLHGQDKAIENVILGVSKCQSEKVLIVASDIPLLTAEAVDRFITLCQKEEADFYYPILARETIQSSFATMQRTYVKIAEGVFTGGNIFFVNPEIIRSCSKKAQKFVELRKSPLKLCSLLGFIFILRFLTRRLNISMVERKVSDLFEIRAKAVVVDYPGIGVDVDKPSDLKIVSEWLEKTV